MTPREWTCWSPALRIGGLLVGILPPLPVTQTSVDVGLTVFICWRGSRAISAFIRSRPDFCGIPPKAVHSPSFFRGLIWVQDIESAMESHEEEASHQRNCLIWKMNFRVSEGEKCWGRCHLQANNSAINCGNPEVASAVSSVSAYSFLD